MATAELSRSRSQIDLEHAGAGGGGGEYDAPEEDEESLCFSDADEEDDHSTYSSYSQFYSTTGGSIDGFSFASGGAGGWSSRRALSEVSVTVDDDADCRDEAVDIKVHLGKTERVCRICHLGLEESGGNDEHGAPMELGCSCKDDLGAAHKHCAETWFKIKGNKICEICNCTVQNVVGANENTDATQHSNENPSSAAEPPLAPAASEPQRFWQGHRFLNFLLACMVFAFVISWLFHFKMPS